MTAERDPGDEGAPEDAAPDDDLRAGRLADRLDAEALAATQQATRGGNRDSNQSTSSAPGQ